MKRIKAFKKLALTIMILTAASSTLAGCSGNTSNTSSNEDVNYFEKDENTVKYSEAFLAKEAAKEKLDQETQEKDKEIQDRESEEKQTIGLVTLKNKDKSKNFEVLNNKGDIDYHGRKLYFLWDVLKNVENELPYKKEVMVNFIAKYLYPNTDEVSTISYSKNDNDAFFKSIDNGLEDVGGYTELVNKHNGKRVTFYIMLKDLSNNEECYIYGCKKYLFIVDSDPITVDMSK